MVKEAMILAGGFGTRLKSSIKDTLPKPMANINGKPFLFYLLNYLKNHNIDKVVLLCHHLSDKIIDHFGDGEKIGIKISYVIEKTPLGTGGAIKNAIKSISNDSFFVFNGDSIFMVDLQKASNFHLNKKSALTLILKKKEDSSRYGSVKLEESLVVSFDEKISSKNSLINSGIYIFRKDVLLNSTFHNVFSLEKKFIPDLVESTKVFGIEMEGNFIDIGLPKTYLKSKKLFTSWFNIL